jgi:hypothetical protein
LQSLERVNSVLSSFVNWLDGNKESRTGSLPFSKQAEKTITVIYGLSQMH